MKVPSPTAPSIGIPDLSINYTQPQTPDFSPLARGLASVGVAVQGLAEEQKRQQDQVARFKATSAFNEFETNAKLRLQEQADASEPGDVNFAERAANSYDNLESEFIATLPPTLQDEFRARASDVRSGIALKAYQRQQESLGKYFKAEIDKSSEMAKLAIAENPETLEEQKVRIKELIANSTWSEEEKFYAEREYDRLLERTAYGKEAARMQIEGRQYAADVKTATTQAAQDLGVSPEDLLTVISFETAGSLSPDQKGGSGGRHRGLIQFGPAEQKRYGITPGMSFGEQMTSVVAYLKDRGFKPGMDIYDLYSTINAGSPGKYNARDGHNGGSPGTVRDKVNQQMAAHRAKAVAILGGTYVPPDNLDADPRYANVPYEDRVTLRNEAETLANEQFAAFAKQQKEQLVQVRNALFTSLYDGTSGRNEIADARAAGILSDYEDIKKANDIVDKREADAADVNYFQTKLAGNGLFDFTDEKDKKAVNKFFGQDGLDKLAAGDQTYVESQLGPLFKQIGMLPSDAVGALDALSRSIDGRKMLFANKALSFLENINPVAYARQVPETTRNRADRWETLANVLSEEDLIRVLAEAPTQEERNARSAARDEARKVLSDPKSEISFDKFLASYDGWATAAPTTPGLYTVAAAMRSEWQTLITENYALTGSWEAAETLTNKQLQRTWGVSTVGGNNVLMKYPPEKLYPAVGGTHDWMTAQLRGELALGSSEKVQLVADNLTQADIAAGRPPSYAITMEKDGVWSVVQVNGRNKRHFFEVTELDKKAHEQSIQLRDAEEQLKEAQKYLPKADFAKPMDTPQDAIETFAIPSGPQDLTVPPELKQEIDDKTLRVEQERMRLEAIKKAAGEQYLTPAQQKLFDLQKQADLLQQELYGFTGTLEEWPKTGEYAKVLDEIDAAQRAVDAEVAAKRKDKGLK